MNKNIIISVLIISMLITNISAVEFVTELNKDQSSWKNLTSEEKLDVCINYYNNCSLDYNRGENCGIAFGVLNSQNDKLINKLQNTERYKSGFFILLIIIILIGIEKIISSMRIKKRNK